MSHNWGSSDRRSRLPGDWRKRRAAILARDPVCVLCGVRDSVIADHIVAKADRHELEDLQGVCEPCHRIKTAQEAAAARAAMPRYTRARPDERHPGLL
ncbi:HNH endonuclease signature motif containing protein [Streptomyces fumanus]|uniref:HNH endonuclease signature motif containing protein n=1 Tax=Streptomyces fumanus TaxID=67302 RepID=UPI00340E0A76